MNETLFEIAGVSITITALYGFISAVILILFMSLWLIGRKKRTGQPIFAGQVMNGIGFGLLPSLAVLKAFQEMSTGKGSKVFEPLPMIQWLTEDGFFRPGRIETTVSLLCFAVLCLWLIFRRNELPDNGDLFMISLCLWATIRLITEDYRDVPQDLFRYTSCGTVLGCLIVTVIRRSRIHPEPGRTLLDLFTVGICIALNLITAEKVLSVGSEIGDYAVKTGSAFLMLSVTLIVGGDLRRMIRKAEI